jgi:hypothetical protein
MPIVDQVLFCETEDNYRYRVVRVCDKKEDEQKNLKM